MVTTSAGLTGGSGDWNSGAARLDPEFESEGEGDRELRRVRFWERSASLSRSLDALRRRVGQADGGVASVGDSEAVEVGGEGWEGVVAVAL